MAVFLFQMFDVFVRGEKLFLFCIILKSLLTVHLFVLVAVSSFVFFSSFSSFVCQMCLVKSLVMFFVVSPCLCVSRKQFWKCSLS